jgi:2-methylisocitrate lyase-like PEP mutase family enzyme
MTDQRRQRFRNLHADGCFTMPNAWDAGSARILASLGFDAIATTSSGHAATLGRLDQHVTLDELVDHATALAAAVDIPLSIDAERCFAATPEDLAPVVERFASTGAAGFSIEDWNPAAGAIDPIDVAAARVAAAAAAAHEHDLVLTARAENLLYDAGGLDDAIARLRAYAEAGADVVYAPGLVEPDDIRRVVESVDRPVNVLARPGGPAVPALAGLGVRRVSTGGALAFAAYGELVRAATELREDGTSDYSARNRAGKAIRAALG